MTESLNITTSRKFAEAIKEVLTNPHFPSPIFELESITMNRGIYGEFAQVKINAKKEYTPEELFWFSFSCTNWLSLKTVPSPTDELLIDGTVKKQSIGKIGEQSGYEF